jgi:hypothetical protein
VRAVDLVVAVGGEHERGHGVHPPGEQPQDVERGLVGPVEILEDHDRRRPAAQLTGQRGEHGARRRALVAQRARLAFELLCHVEERPQRSWRVQRVAGAPQHARGACAVAERSHQRRLADTCLAGDQDEPSATVGAHRRQAVGERGQLLGALEKLVAFRHGAIVYGSATERKPGAWRAPEHSNPPGRGLPLQRFRDRQLSAVARSHPANAFAPVLGVSPSRREWCVQSMPIRRQIRQHRTPISR